MSGKNIFVKWLIDYNINKGGALLILLGITLLPIIILSFCNHPSVDDYAITTIVLKNGFLETQKYYYFNMTGRYFASILLSLNPLVFHIYWAYKLNTIVWLFLLLISIYWLSDNLFKNLKKTDKIGITSLFVFAYILRMPDIGSGLFSLFNIYNNLTPSFMTFFLLGSIISYYHSANKKWYFSLSCLLTIAIIGSYEINMIYIDLIIIVITFISILKKRDLFFPLTLFIVCIIFSIIEIKAPGNNMRELNYPAAHKLLFSIKESVIWSKIFLIHWLHFMLFIGLLLFDLLSNKTLRDEYTDSIFIIPPWLNFIACLAIPFIGLFICFWAQGTFLPIRTVDVSYFYFVAGMIYFSFSLIIIIKKRYPDFRLPVYIKLPLYLILIFELIFRTNNISTAYKDITCGAAITYNRERTERHEFLTNFKGDSCMIDSIHICPNSLFFSELPRCESTPLNTEYYHKIKGYGYDNNWIYASFCEYYHKKYIGIKGRK